MGSKYGEFRVFKYHLPIVRKLLPIPMPADAKVLSTACQGREVYILGARERSGTFPRASVRVLLHWR